MEPHDIEFYRRWLQRLRKDLQPSGRASELAWHLARTGDGDLAQWQRHIRDVLDGTVKASPNLLISITQWQGRKSPAATSHEEDQTSFLD